MEAYKREFIEFLQGAGVLKFGDFTAKSGRKIPYFVNAGMIKTGDQTHYHRVDKNCSKMQLRSSSGNDACA